MNRINLHCLKIAIIMIASMAILLCTSTSSFAQMTDVDRRLHVAVLGFELNEAAAKDALAAGANVNVKNEAMNGETMLITAIKGFKDVKIVRFLLDNGADPAIKDESGKTALDWARQYNIGRDRNGREILKLLEGATIQPSEQPTTKTDKPAVSPKQDKTTRTDPATMTPATKKPRRSVGPPTTEEVKETMEKSFTGIYESHFYGVKNKVTYEWIGPITVGGLQTVRAAPKPCYPVKLKVIVTAEDPRDGNTSTVTRGLGSTTGNYKEEIFCFYRDGFGEWAYGTYGK